MHAFIRLIDPLRQAAAAFFTKDLALQRAEDGLRIVLQERAGAGGKGAIAQHVGRHELQAQKQAQELALIRQQLAELLDELSDTRPALRPLVFVEQALGRKGLRVLQQLPLDVLQRALAQLEGLVTNWSPAGLASLRSKMAVAIMDREHTDPVDAEADAYSTAVVLDRGATPAQAPAEQASDDDALAAAYAALGTMAPGADIEAQAELGAPSARAAALA